MTPTRPKRPFRPIATLVAVASFIALAVSIVAFARHAERFNAERGRRTFAYEQIIAPTFTFAGREVAIEEISRDDESGASRSLIRLRYGDADEIFPVSIEPEYTELPGLRPHEDWMKLFRFIEATAVSKDELKRRLDAGEERLVVVTRNLRPGADPQSWGQVWRRDWTFTFFELLPEGGFEKQSFDFPESKRSYDRRVRAARAAGEDDPPRNPDELKQGTWPFEVALQVMPPGAGPSLLYGDNAIASAGWRLRVAAVSILTLTVSLVWVFAPARRTD